MFGNCKQTSYQVTFFNLQKSCFFHSHPTNLVILEQLSPPGPWTALRVSVYSPLFTTIHLPLGGWGGSFILFMKFCPIGTLAEALLYAAEAYHPRGTIRHVVGGMQLKVMGRLVQYSNSLSTHHLWVSMIENWGESNKEYNHCNQDLHPTLNKCFLKMSKYLSRMFNAMRLLRTRLPPNDRFTLLDFGDPKDPEYAALMWLRYKKEGKREIPEDTNNRIRLFLDKFECQAAAKTQNLEAIKLSPECLGNIQKNVNLYNVKLAGALTQSWIKGDVTMQSPWKGNKTSSVKIQFKISKSVPQKKIIIKTYI